MSEREGKTGLLHAKFNLGDFSKYRNEIYGLAILWIMLYHGYHIGIEYESEKPVFNVIADVLSRGNLGVEILLLLSGICLYFSYTKDKRPGRFLAKRLKRIVPAALIVYVPYWIYEATYVSVFNWQHLLVRIFGADLWASGGHAIWFATFIILCYIIYPYAYEWLFHKEKGSFLRMLLIVALYIPFLFAFARENPDYYKGIEIAITRIPVFLIGCWMGKLVYEKKEISVYWIILFFVLMVGSFHMLDTDWMPKTKVGPVFRLVLLMGGISAAFVFAFISRFFATIVRKVLAFFAGISFELYLTHLMYTTVYNKGLIFTFISDKICAWTAILLLSIVTSKCISLAIGFVSKKIEANHSN